jgi:hypothetical protein
MEGGAEEFPEVAAPEAFDELSDEELSDEEEFPSFVAASSVLSIALSVAFPASLTTWSAAVWATLFFSLFRNWPWEYWQTEIKIIASIIHLKNLNAAFIIKTF